MSPTVRQPTVVDLFAGCGGGSLGFLAAGFRAVGAVEVDPDAAEAYEVNVGLRPLVRDISSVDGTELLRPAGLRPGELTLLFGCPPCQSFTILRRGSDTTPIDLVRNALPSQYLRLVDELRPRHLAFENVPGMVEGRWRPQFQALLASLRALGYHYRSAILDAADYGVPQRRRRLLVIASRVTEARLPLPTHAAHGTNGLAIHRTVREAIGHLRPLQSAEADPDDPLHRARRHSSIALSRLRAVPEGGGRKDLPADLQLDCHKGHNGHYDIYGRMWWDGLAPTLTSGCTNVTRGRFGHPEQDRAITLREAMLLQGFPGHAVLWGGAEAMALQVGNAVPPPLTESVGRTVLEMERATQAPIVSPTGWPSTGRNLAAHSVGTDGMLGPRPIRGYTHSVKGGVGA
jgi:DNA (cytosine-5)-methyltransferase 1